MLRFIIGHDFQVTNNRGAEFDFLTKENKTLNVNVLASNPYEEQIQNNKINFDSEKYHTKSRNQKIPLTDIKKSRPHETIDNNLGLQDLSTCNLTNKQEKEKNKEAAIVNDFQAIKRYLCRTNFVHVSQKSQTKILSKQDKNAKYA